MLVPGREPVSSQLFPREPLEGGSDLPQSCRRGAGWIQLGELDELRQPGPGGCGRAGKGLRGRPGPPQDSRPSGALFQRSQNYLFWEYLLEHLSWNR